MVYREVGLALVVALVGVSLAGLGGQLQWWLPLALSGYSGWHLSQAVRLVRWLARDNAADSDSAAPQSRGLWGTVFALLYQRQRAHRAESEHLTADLTAAREVAASFSEALVIIDALGTIIWCNPAARSLLGLRFPRDRGRLLVDVVRDSAFYRYLLRGDFNEALSLRLARNPALCLSIQVSEYSLDGRLIMARDITQFDRLESMRVDFVANVSHELRTPLTVINGYLETLSSLDEEGVPSSMLGRALEPMLAQCSRMEALVNDLTTLSRLESRTDVRDSGQVIAVDKLVGRLVAEAPLSHDKQISIDVEPTVRLLGQEKEIHSAFGNLINNACKYTRAQGHVLIVWRLESGRAIFEVRDDGDGIAAEHLPRLTERFYRVDKSRSVSTGGTGLGLAIVKHALMRHQATLEIDSEPGRGSCFRCVFPLHRVRQKVRS